MNKIIFTLLFSLSFSLPALADGDHTADFCSATDKTVCAHIGHMKGMKSKGESEFVLDIVVKKPVSNVKVDLWMPEHNHGSTPVEMSPYKKNKYKVKKAMFSMPGKWHVRAEFDIEKEHHKLEIPLDISK